MKISHQKTFYVLRSAHVRYVKNLFTNIQKQQSKIKSTSYLLRNLQTSRVNNSRILRVKKTKFSRYYFYMNKKKQEDFQICTSVPLTLLGEIFTSVNKPRLRYFTRILIKNRQDMGYALKIHPKRNYVSYSALQTKVTFFDEPLRLLFSSRLQQVVVRPAK